MFTTCLYQSPTLSLSPRSSFTLKHALITFVISLLLLADIPITTANDAVCSPKTSAITECLTNVTEHSPPGTIIFDVMQHFPGISVIIVSGIDEEHLASDTELVTTVGNFDREEMVDSTTAPNPVYFTASFFYYSGLALHEIAVKILVHDLDDNVPVFYSENTVVTGMFYVETPESDNSKQIATLYAKDFDEGINGTQEYILGEGSSPYFNITVERPNNGVPIVRLVSNGVLDREEKAHHNVFIIAMEGNDVPDSVTLNVSINVTDINDNPPSFPMSEYSQVVYENASINTHIIQVVAKDPDEGKNAIIEYKINSLCRKETESGSCKQVSTPDYPFALDLESGMLTLTETLNYEDAVSYRVTIDATNPDTGGSSTAIVTIDIKDTNDHAPQVINYNPSGDAVTEDAISGSLVASFNINDDDSDEYSYFFLMLLDTETMQNSTKFEIQKTSNIYTVVLKGEVDREEKDSYMLQIVATDSLNTSLFSTYQFTVYISDVNDHAPVIEPVPDPILLKEGSSHETLVLHVNATDKDIGINANIKFSLPSNSDDFPYQDQFTIGATNGRLKVEEIPDRESNPYMYVKIVARDKNGEGLSSSVVVNITVTDVNDNAPTFTSVILADILVKENETLGTEILDVDATDKDIGENAQLTYSISSSSPLPISISSTTGVITLNDSLDHENKKVYTVKVSVSDGYHTPPTSHTFQLTVLDVNDNNPYFPQLAYFKSLHENASINTHVVTVTAEDADSAEFTQITYSFSDNFDHSHFNLNSKTGEITTASTFDWETIPKYVLEVVANDGNGRLSLVDCNVTVTITDANDEIPRFIMEPYVFTIEENIQANDHVGQVFAESKEQGDHGKPVFSIINTSPVPFIIQPESGVIVPNGTIDRETKDMYTLFIKVDDVAPPINDNSTEAIVIVTDVNDNPPVFEHDLVSIELSELHAVNSGFYTAIATDADLYPNNVTLFSLGNLETQFQIDPNTGVLSLTSSLDYEDQKSILVDIIAKDSLKPVHFTDTMQLNITVLDDNNTNITFPNDFPLQYNIQENAPLDEVMLNFTAHDSKGNPQTHLNYYISLADGMPSDKFDIEVEADSGYAILRTSGELDRETTPSYNLNITITDLNMPPNKVTQFLTVVILDVNDNSPTFINAPYVFSFDEEQKGELPIAPVVAYDPDSDENGTITYTLQESSEYFTIGGSTGVLSQLQPLDRESIESHDIVVIATDNGTPSKQSTTMVTINVTDINDHCPEYSPVFITVKENIQIGTVVETVVGTDADIGANGEVYFSINEDQHSTATNHFTFLSNGNLVVSQVPDYEKQNNFIFYIKVSDKGDPKCEIPGNLTIQITDQNDNAPLFTGTQEYYTVDVSEDKTFGHVILPIEAVDDDTGMAADVNYEIESYTDGIFFEIGSDSGVLKLKQSLDYETQTQYIITVLAYDNGSPRNWVSRQDVTINVLNVDDNDPKFDNNIYSFVVKENQVSQTLVGTLRATDADIGANDDLTYAMSQLIPAGKEFAVSQTAEYARITTLNKLDYEMQPYYLLNLTVYSKEKHASALVQIYIENLNDENPLFSMSNYPLSVSELSPIGSTLVFVMATDADNNTNDAVWYSITSGNDGNFFYVDSATGEIRLNKQLDYESETSYTLTLTATDTGDPPLSATATVTISVLNENEHSPVFNLTKYSFSVLEEEDDVTTVGQVMSTDADTDSVIEYSIEDNDVFSIDSSTGVIKTKVSIDREATPTFNDLTVMATDGSMSGTVTVAITVVDINDNVPLFENSLYQLSIPFDQSSYQSIGKVTATDADSPSNAVTVYSLSDIPSGAPIGVNSTTGDIYLTASLPNDYKHSYKFTLTATDEGDTSFSNQTTIEVFTYTPTDHPPFFEELLYEVNVTEGQTPMEVGQLVTAKATDVDGNTLTYSLDDSYQKFTIDSNGAITLTNSLDYETATSYDLTAYVTDTTQRTASTTVLVTVINTNDNTPQFVNLQSSITLSPVSFVNVDLFQLEASDIDQSPYTFSTLSQTNVFDIDSETGTVYNKIPLINGVSYTPKFRVSDGNSNSDANIVVTVATPPSDSPRFTKDTLNLTVSESESTGYIVHTFTAINPSDYNIACCESASDVFTINTATGVLSLKTPLDYETETEYELVIEARDQISSSVIHSDYQKVSLMVSNVNEYSPVFTVDADKTVNEGLTGETVITQVDAQDDDVGAFGDISFSIIDGNIDQTFIIDSTSGVISLASGKTLDRETQSKYELLVKAMDGGSKSTDLLVTVTILDLNDSPPTYTANITIGVYETAQSGDRIAHVRATDLDSNSQIGYSLGIIDSYLDSEFQGVASSKFEINQTTAVVTLHGDLDREKHDLYIVQVSATDTNSVVAKTFLHVQVLDVNDNSPSFEQDYGATVTVHELSSVGTEVLRVTADDEDTGFNNIVLYSLGNDWPDSEFVIDELSGVIRVNSEILYNSDDCTDDMFTGTVIATDGIYTTSTEITINIQDVNNHEPMFIGSPYDLLVSETAMKDSVIATITVPDNDCSLNGNFDTYLPTYYHYPFDLFSFNYINLETKTYELRVKAPLVQGVYRFRIQAFNSLPNPHALKYFKSGFGVFTVTVLPENIHTPVFQYRNYTFKISEDTAVLYELGVIKALDSDLGAAGNITYSFLEEDVSSFTINPTSGSLSVTQPLDYELVPRYTVTVIATDGGYPSKTTNTTINIILIDVNDNPPEFSSSFYQLSISENIQSGEILMKLPVNDTDTVTSNTVRYEIENGRQLPFDIDNNTGILSVSGSIDYERNSSFNMNVTVRDTTDILLTHVSTCRVLINVIGVNEFPPVFLPSTQLSFVVDASSDMGDYIGTVSAVDNDQGPDGSLTYSFSREPNPSFFVISSNGSIFLSKEYSPDNVTRISSDNRFTKRQTSNGDDERFPVIGEVEVTDGGSPPRSARANVTVLIPRAVEAPSTVSPSGSSLPVSTIGGIGGGFVVLLILIVFIILVINLLYKRSRRWKQQKFSPGVVNPQRSSFRPSTPGTTTSQVELHNYVSTGEGSGNNQEDTYVETQIQATPINDLSESPDGEVRYQYRPTRSTSDLASSVATDTLNLTQETGFQYSKAQLEQIYATNMNLLTDHSQDSVHMFGSEGGGEAEGDEMDDMMFAKYGVELEEVNDGSSYCGKSRNSLISECSEEARDEYQFSQSTNPWSSRHSIVDRSMNELASVGGSRPMMYHFESSQPAVMYGGTSTQGSTVSLTRSLHHRNNKYGSERDISHQYPPHSSHMNHHHHNHHQYHHPSAGTHHSHVPQYEYYPEVPLPTHRRSPVTEYRSESKKLPGELPPPPYLSQDPMYYPRGNQYYQHTGSSISPDPNQPPYETLLSTSSTSLSTNASQSRGRHYLPPMMTREQRYH